MTPAIKWSKLAPKHNSLLPCGWHGLLHAMGGELVPKKCVWYLIDFEISNEGIRKFEKNLVN